MSRPLKLKVQEPGGLTVFQLPDHGFLGQFAGAHRKRFSLNPNEEIRPHALCVIFRTHFFRIAASL